MLLCLLFVPSSKAQCNSDNNSFAFLHPAFTGKNWAATAYDSIFILTSDAICNAGPLRFDICGFADSAIGMFIGQTKALYMVKTSYTCQGGCTPCVVEFFDPIQIRTSGIAFANSLPLYVPKNNAIYGKTFVNVLVATAQQQVLSLSVSIANQAILKQDTLKLTSLSAAQEIIRVLGQFDSTLNKDIGVWICGSQGLLRYIPLANDQWGSEIKYDLATTDTVFCVGNGYAGTSSGALYAKNANVFAFKGMFGHTAIMNIYSKGAVGKQGTLLTYIDSVWAYKKVGNADYVYGNFTDRWDGAGVELIDAAWKKSAITYYDYPSRIASTKPFAYSNNFNYQYSPTKKDTVSITLSDPDNSYADFSFSVKDTIDLKNNGQYSIVTVGGDSQCPTDSLRLKTGIVRLILSPFSIQTDMQCMLGKYLPLCQANSWVDYAFTSTKQWAAGDVILVRTGLNSLKITNNPTVAVVNRKSELIREYVSCHVIGSRAVFSINMSQKNVLKSISLYTVKGQLLQFVSVDNNRNIYLNLPHIVSSILYAKYVFADGSFMHQSIPLLR